MQVNYPSMSEILIFIWFALSVFIAVTGTVVLWFWLRRRGVKLVYGLTGVPGYMERAYVAWCRNNGQQPNKTMIVLRAISIINLIVAAAVAIPILASR